MSEWRTIGLGFQTTSMVRSARALPNEKAAARKAVALDNNSPAAHFALGNAYCDNWEWTSAEREYQRALELDPKFAYAVPVMRVGKQETFLWLEKAYAERSRALQWIQVQTSMDALRPDPRYADLLRRMGMLQ
jgi:tetratricopeptide (TPR) repeat protein